MPTNNRKFSEEIIKSVENPLTFGKSTGPKKKFFLKWFKEKQRCYFISTRSDKMRPCCVPTVPPGLTKNVKDTLRILLSIRKSTTSTCPPPPRHYFKEKNVFFQRPRLQVHTYTITVYETTSKWKLDHLYGISDVLARKNTV